LREPGFLDVEDEAVGICALICSREPGKTLKLGDLSDAYEEYSPHLRQDHPALMMVIERFDDIAYEAEEEALRKIEELSLPSEAEAALKDTIRAWRSPEERLGGGANKEPLWKQAKEMIAKLRLEHERLLIARLPIVNNQESYGAMMAEVEREFCGERTILRGQLRAGRNRHRALLETELQTMYGWPPRGPGPSLKRAARQYVTELGAEHPLVEDFVVAARLHVKEKETKCVQEMADLEKEILRLRALVTADPPAPKLLHEGYLEQLNEKCLEAMQRLETWKQDLGEDSPVYLRFLKSTMGTAKFLDHCEARAAEIADELRPLGARPPPSLEENHVTESRAIGATALAHFLEELQAGGRHAKAAALKAEFSSELKRAEDGVMLFKVDDEDSEGWHMPCGFRNVEASEKAAEAPSPPPPPKEFRMERELPGMKEGESLSMRLHGVSFEDVYRHNEILLLEMCADIIAEECKIPRDCIFNLSFSDPKKTQKKAEDESPVVEDTEELLPDETPSAIG